MPSFSFRNSYYSFSLIKKILVYKYTPQIKKAHRWQTLEKFYLTLGDLNHNHSKYRIMFLLLIRLLKGNNFFTCLADDCFHF